MQTVIREWKSLDREEKVNFFKRSEEDISQVVESCAKIIEQVKNQGDKALRELTQKIDHNDPGKISLCVQDEEFTEAEKILSAELKSALKKAIFNVEKFHLTQKASPWKMEEIQPGLMVGEKPSPIDSVGMYVPGGRGSFPSMLYMLAVPAKIAGVKKRVLCTPCREDGTVDPAILYTARLCDVDEVYRLGGAIAVAAMCYGTETIPAVCKIIGPGSKWVAAAKRLVSADVDTALPAGPSESMILADNTTNPEIAAYDLLIEAEHGSDSSAFMMIDCVKTARKTEKILLQLLGNLPEPRKGFVMDVFKRYGAIILTESKEQSINIINDFAPEHLEILTQNSEADLEKINNAGEILLGPHTPFSLANYAAGANAVLPTGGKAKTWSAVSVRDFIKFSSVVKASPQALADISEDVILLADHEGFFAHAEALRFRKK